MQIPLIKITNSNYIGSQYNYSEIFWFNRISQKQRVNEMEQVDEYINAFDFLNNFQC